MKLLARTEFELTNFVAEVQRFSNYSSWKAVPFESQSPREFYDFFSWTDSSQWMYHLVVWSTLNLWYNSQLINFIIIIVVIIIIIIIIIICSSCIICI